MRKQLTSETLSSGQLAEQAGLTRGALRLYEKHGLIEPVQRTEAGYRAFSPDTVITLKAIKVVCKAGFTLTEVRALLALVELEPFNAKNMSQALTEKIEQVDQRITHLARFKRFLTRVSADPNMLLDPNCDAMLELAMEKSVLKPKKITPRK
jgi:MerR family transcriptional regulator, copper efflux regulator